MLGAALAQERRNGEGSSGVGLILGVLGGLIVIPLLMSRGSASAAHPVLLMKIRVGGASMNASGVDATNRAVTDARVIDRVRSAVMAAFTASQVPGNARAENIRNGVMEMTMIWPQGSRPHLDLAKRVLERGSLATSLVQVKTGMAPSMDDYSFVQTWSRLDAWEL